MNVFPCRRAAGRGLVGAMVFVLTFLAAIGLAADITGSYADKGTAVASDGSLAPDGISLRALLNLEFDSATAGIIYENTSRVDLVQLTRDIDTRFHTVDGILRWRGEYWRTSGGLASDGERVVLSLRKNPKEDLYFLIFERLDQENLLLVSVTRISPTIIGPSARPVGTYVFNRL